MDFFKFLRYLSINKISFSKLSLIVLAAGTTLLVSLLCAQLVYIYFFNPPLTFYKIANIIVPESFYPIITVLYVLYIVWAALVLKRIFYFFYYKKRAPQERYSVTFDESLSNVIFQGNVQIIDKKTIALTNSDPGVLIEKGPLNFLVWRNFEANFLFNFYNEKLNESLKESLEWRLDIVDNQLREIPTKYWVNYLGFIFRAQNLNNYFMISVGVKLDRQLDKQGHIPLADEILLTPHIRLDGRWEALTQTKIYVRDFRLHDFHKFNCRLKENRLELWLELEKPFNKHKTEISTWHLPTNFREGKPIENGRREESEDIFSKDASRIPFHNYYGMIGFRCYNNEYAVVKNITIKAL